jgi:hypothetical protein
MAVAIFIALNVADAWLTKSCLAMGAAESNPIVASFGASPLVKGLIAAGIVIGLYLWGKERLLWWANFAFIGIVLWNLQWMGVLNLLPV